VTHIHNILTKIHAFLLALYQIYLAAVVHLSILQSHMHGFLDCHIIFLVMAPHMIFQISKWLVVLEHREWHFPYVLKLPAIWKFEISCEEPSLRNDVAVQEATHM